MNQLHYNQEKSPKRTPANAARKAFWDAAIGDNSKLANLAKAAIAEAEQQSQPAEQSKGQDLAKFFLPPALHDGIAENTAGTYRLRVTGLTIRQIKDIFEDKFLGSMMWANGAAYPTDGVEIRFVKDKPDTTPPAQPSREWVELDEKDRLDILQNSADEFDALELTAKKLREKNAGLPAAVPDDLPAILKKQAS